jgi:hypothetical protein
MDQKYEFLTIILLFKNGYIQGRREAGEPVIFTGAQQSEIYLILFVM